MDFEKSFLRLEEILEKMNSGSITLDASLKLYEEADGLIKTCAKRLSDAETKIETLIKDRSGTLAKNEAGEPLTQAFSVDNAPTT